MFENEDEDELKEELECGEKAARDLVEHLENMGGAAKCSMSVETEDGCYVVEVRKTL